MRDWSTVFKEFEKINTTVKEFYQAQGMSPSLFYRRRKDINDLLVSTPPLLNQDDFVRLRCGLGGGESAEERNYIGFCISVIYDLTVQLRFDNLAPPLQ